MLERIFVMYELFKLSGEVYRPSQIDQFMNDLSQAYETIRTQSPCEFKRDYKSYKKNK